jgi:hypothetical protein
MLCFPQTLAGRLPSFPKQVSPERKIEMRIRNGYVVIFCVVLTLVISFGGRALAQNDEPDPLLEAQNANVEVLSQIGNVSTQVIAVHGKYGYIGTDTGIVMVDLTMPTQPRLLEQAIDLPGRVVDIQIAGSSAYVAAGRGLFIFDISTPTRPIRIGSYEQAPGFYVSGMEVRGNYAYMSAGEGGLIILDVSDPANPTKIGKYGGVDESDITNSIYVTGVALVDNYAYAIASYGYYSSALRILDVTNPMSPTQVSEYQGYFSDITIEDQRAYLVSSYAGLEIFDVSNPVALTRLGSYTPPGDPRKVAVSGGNAYLITSDSGLRILNVADPKMPIETSFYTPVGAVRDVVVDEDYIYIAVGGSGLHILDASNPYAPAAVGVLLLPLWDAQHVMLTGGYALVASAPRYYPSSAELPTQSQGNTDKSGTEEERIYPNEAVAGSMPPPAPGQPAYPINPYAPVTTLNAVDVTTPTAPKWGGAPMSIHNITNMTAVGNELYVFDQQGVVTLYNVANPHTPVVLGTLLVDSYYFYYAYKAPLAASDRIAYVAASYQLHIIDFTVPTTPTHVSAYLDMNVLDMAVDGNYLYTAGESGIQVIDVSVSTQPEVIGYFPTQSPVNAIQVVDGHAYIVTGDWYGPNRLRIVDVTRPDSLREVGSYATPGQAFAIVVADSYAYVGDSRGLRIYNVADPTRPWVAAAFDTASAVADIVVSGDEIYLAATYQGLFILKFVPATWTLLPPSGGVLRSQFDNTIYTFASGTFTDTVTVKHTIRSATTMPGAHNLIVIGHVFETSAQTKQEVYLQPTKPYQLETEYSATKTAGAIESTLALYFWDGVQWVKEPTSMLDAANRKVTATPQQLGRWAILGETHRAYMPMISGAR